MIQQVFCLKALHLIKHYKSIFKFSIFLLIFFSKIKNFSYYKINFSSGPGAGRSDRVRRAARNLFLTVSILSKIPMSSLANTNLRSFLDQSLNIYLNFSLPTRDL